MKKYILTVISLIFSISTYAQQPIPSEFFGLEYDKSYSLQEIISHIGENGIYSKTVDTIMYNRQLSGHIFENVTYNGREYPCMCIFTFTSDILHIKSNAFGGATFSFTNENIPEKQSLDSIYNELSSDLSSKYTMIDIPDPITNTIGKVSELSEGDNGIVKLRYQKVASNGIVTLEYMSLIMSFANIVNTILPTIQDTFFGLKIGSHQTISTIKSAVGYKGTFLNEEKESYSNRLTFKDIMFAGKTWDFGTFSLTENGELYNLSVNISLTDYKSDDQKEADKTYESFKTRLAEKYGEAKEGIDDEGKFVGYIGNNGIGLSLSKQRSKSKGGDYRLYVTLNYYSFEIYQRLFNQSNDEL